MSQIFFDQLDIQPPKYNLGIREQTHGAMTGKMLLAIEEILQAEMPDWVLVYGDTNSTLSGALAASKLHIPVAHVESGLRSFNRRMPEEINRIVTDHLATLLFCPTQTAVENLAAEGIKSGVHLVGDVMYDAFLMIRSTAKKRSTILKDLDLKSNRYTLATVHRQENTDNHTRLAGIFKALDSIASSTCPVIVPLHPRTRKRLAQVGYDISSSKHLRFLDPVGYVDMVALETNAQVILTDSGGIQKEACFAGVPCITMRDETEWGELVAQGVNKVVGADPDAIKAAYDHVLCSPYSQVDNLFGDGDTAGRIIEIMREGQIPCFQTPGN
jgi:UDP-N-acetylglucosamine 2-epimerase